MATADITLNKSDISLSWQLPLKKTNEMHLNSLLQFFVVQIQTNYLFGHHVLADTFENISHSMLHGQGMELLQLLRLTNCTYKLGWAIPAITGT